MLASILSTIFAGGATGLIGVVFQRFFDYQNKKQDLIAARDRMAHEVKLREADAKIMEQEWKGRTQVAEVEAAGKEAVADSQAFAASFNEPIRYSENVKTGPVTGFLLVLLDLTRGIVRPGLTLYLCWIATQMYNEQRALATIIDASTQPEAIIGMLRLIIETLLYLFTTCVLWWFGTRNKQAPPKR